MNSRRLKKIVGNLLYFSGVVHLFSAVKRLLGIREVTVLMYHRVVDGKDMLDRNVVTGDRISFYKQIAYLASKCNIVSFDELDMYRSGDASSPKRAVVITFDDGYRDNYEVAYPILQKMKATATIALTTGFIGGHELFWWDKLAYCIHRSKKTSITSDYTGKISLHDEEKAIRVIQSLLKTHSDPMKNKILNEMLQKLEAPLISGDQVFLTWEEINEMSLHGITFVPHTVSHPILTKISLHDAKKEIMDSKRAVESAVGKKTVVFVYPNGKTEDMSEELDEFLKQRGFRFCLTTLYGTNRITPALFRLRRVGIEKDDDMALFKIKVHGFGRILAAAYEKMKKRS
jgi:peptidoglycan/xylan/chitin deacetylase (PgdA/CDA1 family)